MVELFNTAIYNPLYNAFIFIINIIPGADVGIAIVILTILVKSALLPLTHKSVSSQAKIKEIDPEVREVKEKYKEDKQEQARKIMELYKKHNVNPFSGCFSVVIQIPIVLGLFYVFFRGLNTINPSILYSFIEMPVNINMVFLGLVSLTEKSMILAFLAGATQYIQIKLSMPPIPPKKDNKEKISFKDELVRGMNMQMRYVLPGIVFFVAYSISGAVALYWITSNLVSVSHELYVKRKAKNIIHMNESDHGDKK
ncbi:MAG TPA: membrane protein insertase YidC [Candidatus Kaiserbacteria bacterium]|mgnify:CR=1 FL=1|nr:membrane protein insertase YidC [Candidatus Kaiserbacteria bacterium]